VKSERNQTPPGEELQDGSGQQPPIVNEIAMVVTTCGGRAPELVLDSLL
jgi:hypothetical protein